MAHQPPPEAKSLPQPPTDGITSLSYLPGSNLVASTSWDGSVRIHDTSSMTPVLSHAMDSGPLLSLATLSDREVVTGGLDGSVRKLDINASTYTVLGRHTGGEAASGGESKVACSSLSSVETGALVASAGWDCMFHLWDVRVSPSSGSSAVASVKLPGKAFGMDYDPAHHRIVVATSGRRTCFLDVRKTGTDALVNMALDRESSLKYQTRTIKFFPGGSGVALGSIEGRVAVEFLDDLGIVSGKKKYAFKCHRDGDVVYPVNAIAFHPQFGTFATGGCEGTVVIWDGLNKKKLSTLPKFPTSIAALAFNHDGSELAIASSYTFEEGDRDHPRDEIFIRQILESECKPKTSK